MDTDENEIVDAEIVDDSPERHASLVPDTILLPCHHGCTCGLHQQVHYGERVPVHPPTDLDHGEMGLLVEAVADATRVLNNYHDYFRKLREVVTQTHGRANRALDDLATLLGSDVVGKACAERDRVEQEYADLTPAERQPAPRWVKVMAVVAVVGMVVFDAYFFQQIFLNIMQVSPGDPWWKQDIGLVAALVMAIGLIAAGRVLAGPIWRMARRWRRPDSPDDPPPRRSVRMARVVAVGAAPAATFFVLGWWASFRGQYAVIEQLNVVNNTNDLPIAPPFAVMLLLLSLALTVIVLEILVYNPYQADRKRAERTLASVRKQISGASAAAGEALDTHEIKWRDLRSARDEVISFVQAEMARPWQTVILPARLRHGRAGPKSAAAMPQVKIELVPAASNGVVVTGTDQVRISYQIFEGMTQPQPGPGPLAEVVRTVIELDPQRLRQRQRRLDETLRAQFGDPAGVAGQSAEEDE